MLREQKMSELTPDQESRIKSVFDIKKSEHIIRTCGTTVVRVKDLITLRGLIWVNDEIMNMYMCLLQQNSLKGNGKKVFFHNSFLWSKFKAKGYESIRRWTMKHILEKKGYYNEQSIFDFELMLIPVNKRNMHWYFVGADFVNHKFIYGNSLSPRGRKGRLGKGLKQICNDLREYIDYEYQEKIKCNKTIYDLNWNQWSHEEHPFPQQTGGTECGVFTMKGVSWKAAGLTVDFKAEDMPLFRKQLQIEIITGQIL